MVRSSNGKYELQVLYGGESSSLKKGGAALKLEEFELGATSKECDCFVETDLDVDNCSYPMETIESDPFGEEFTQTWNVTPYELKITNHSDKPTWVYLFIDGIEDFGKHYLEIDESKVIEGFTSKDRSIEEFLFSRPRLLQKNEEINEPTDEEKFECASIKAVFYRVKEIKTVTTYASAGDGRERGSGGSDFGSKNKKVAHKAQVGATSRAGKQLKAAKKSQPSPKHEGGAPKMVTNTNWVLDYSGNQTTVRIRYAMADNLRMQGIAVKEKQQAKPEPEPEDDEVIDLLDSDDD